MVKRNAIPHLVLLSLHSFRPSLNRRGGLVLLGGKEGNRSEIPIFLMFLDIGPNQWCRPDSPGATPRRTLMLSPQKCRWRQAGVSKRRGGRAVQEKGIMKGTGWTSHAAGSEKAGQERSVRTDRQSRPRFLTRWGLRT